MFFFLEYPKITWKTHTNKTNLCILWSLGFLYYFYNSFMLHIMLFTHKTKIMKKSEKKIPSWCRERDQFSPIQSNKKIPFVFFLLFLFFKRNFQLFCINVLLTPGIAVTDESLLQNLLSRYWILNFELHNFSEGFLGILFEILDGVGTWVFVVELGQVRRDASPDSCLKSFRIPGLLKTFFFLVNFPGNFQDFYQCS